MLYLGLTSSVIRVAIDRPISWYCGPFPRGPSRMKRNLCNTNDRFGEKSNPLSAHLSSLDTEYKEKEAEKSRGLCQQFVYNLVVMGTSARPLSSTAGARRTKATTGRSRNSSSPTRTLDASAPGGIFFMKCRSICEAERNHNSTASLDKRLVWMFCPAFINNNNKRVDRLKVVITANNLNKNPKYWLDLTLMVHTTKENKLYSC